MRPPITIAIILVNYRSEHRSIQCIREELTRCTLPHRIVVVNNGATEQSDNHLSRELNASIIDASTIDYTTIDDEEHSIDTERQIFIISNRENSGFARGNNLGVDFITTHFKAEYLLFSNNDIHIKSDNAIELLTAKLATLPNVGVIGPKIVGIDGEIQSPYIYSSFWREMVLLQWKRFIPFFRSRLYNKGKIFNRQSAKEGYYYRVMGSFFITRSEDYIACGKMDPNTFLYGEEVILAERMLLIGKRNYYDPSVEIIHEHGATINNNREVLRGGDYLTESLFYYFKEYRGVSNLSIFIARHLRRAFESVRQLYNSTRCKKH